jgi:LmbE family N-acetylglucosaminyl deacetylase
VIWGLVGFGLLIAAALAADFGWSRLVGKLNDEDVPVASGLEGQRIMAIWAHPDDEITCAGTLALAARHGAEITLVYLTAGEAAKDTGYTREVLAEVRRKEAAAAGAMLGAKHVEVLDFPDGGLPATDGRKARAAISALIKRHAPDTLVGSDEQVGFYGHPDHVQAGRWLREVVEAGRRRKGFPVKRLYQVTLPKNLLALAMKLIDAFRNNYPTDPAKGLPAATMAVRITPAAATKRRLLDVHASQKTIIADVQPCYDRIPAWLYYRLFDREYFTLAVSL